MSLGGGGRTGGLGSVILKQGLEVSFKISVVFLLFLLKPV